MAGPTMVVGVVNGGVWKAMPSAAGTGVQSQSGSAAHALPLAGRLVAGRAAGSRVKRRAADCVGGRCDRRDPSPTEVQGRDLPRRRPAREAGGVGRLDVPGSGRAGAVVEEHPHQRCLGGEVGSGRGQGRCLGEPDGRQRCLREIPERRRSRRTRRAPRVAERIRLGRDLVGHVEVEELEPPADGLRIGGVDVVAVDHVGEDRRRLRDGVDERRPLGSGLLVLEGARDEDRDLDVGGPVDHGAAVEEGRVAARTPVPGATICGPTRPVESLGLVVEGLVGQAGRRRPVRCRQLGVDLVVGPGLADVGHWAWSSAAPGARRGTRRPAWRRRCGSRPTGGEPVVVDPARVPGREQVVGRAHRGDGGQARRVGAGGGELGQARVADADHPHLVVGHPGLVGDDLDGVVGVVVGRIAEEVEGATRAARPPHLEADGGEPGHPGHHRAHVGGGVGEKVRVTAIGARCAERAGDQRGDGVGRAGDVVAGVFDDRGARTAGRAGRAVGVADGGRQLDAVTHGDVVESLVHRLVGVERRVGRWIGARGQYGEGRRVLAARAIEPGVALTRTQVTDDERAQRLGSAGIGRVGDGHSLSHENDVIARVGAGEPGLLYRPVSPEGRGRRRTRRIRQHRTQAEADTGKGAEHGHRRRSDQHGTHGGPPST